MSDVPLRRVSWLWRPYIADGKLTLISGNPGDGKGFVIMAVAAIVTRGSSFSHVDHEDHPQLEPGRVLYFTHEDDPEDTIGPRLKEMGADMTRVALVRRFTTLGDPAIEATIAQLQPRLVVVDTLQDYIGKADMNSAPAMAMLLGPFQDLAKRYGFAAILVRHLRKGAAGKAIYKGMGSVAITGKVRSELLVGQDPRSKRRALVPIKTTNAGRGKAIEFKIVPVAGANDLATLEWCGPCDLTAADLLEEERPTAPSKKDAAAEVVLGLLADGPIPSAEGDEACKAAGFTEATIRRAKESLMKSHGLKSRQESAGGRGTRRWWWCVPGQEPPRCSSPSGGGDEHLNHWPNSGGNGGVGGVRQMPMGVTWDQKQQGYEDPGGSHD